MRGLGERQYKERLMTKYKIVSLLDVSPFTFEQLWRISRIQRNVLRKNLNSLVEEETILVHNYSIPYNQEFYGYMYKYPVP
jgi:DNA-binding HxlR family transcriptional regulator